ncbi:MAG TPA: AMP-binding protein [Terriglobales bacterium]|nr:AMP-binding protein [Terriglobales bacterium]
MPTFYDQFVACEQRWPGNVALEMQRRDGLESYTCSDLRRMAESIARWLVDQGQQPGSRIAIFADNHPRWTAAYLGAIAAGCTAVPLDTAFHADQVRKLLKDSGSSLLFTDSRHLTVAQQAASALPVAIVLTDAPTEHVARAPSPATNLDEIFAAGPGSFRPIPAGSDDIAAILYTSGTTADPKGVMLTHANLLGECDAVFGLLRLGPSDAVLGVLPLFHALAQMANLLLPLVKGARVVYLETLNSTELLRALSERKVTAFACVPQFFYLIHERIQKEIARKGKLAQFGVHLLIRLTRFLRPLGWNSGKLFFRPIHRLFGSKMRYLITGGSRWDPQIGRDFYSLGIDILQAYGLTETTGGAMCTPPNEDVIGSVGKPLPTVEVKIVDPQSQDNGPDVGEIAIRGPIVMKGYWNRPEATAAVLREGWLHTGDLGYFDGKGNLFITGRKKELIVLSSGKNIYPEEIEAHYQKSPFIKEICVIGLVSRPGDPFSERLHGVIVPSFEVLRQRKIVNAKEVIRYDIEGLSQQLASTKRILSYEVWPDDLPRTTTRKLRRFEIEKRVRANQAKSHADNELPAQPAFSEDDFAWLEQPEVKRALRIVRTSAKTAPETIRPQDNLELDLGLDSMQRVELLVALEKELGGDIDESRLSEIYTVRELVDEVRESAARGSAPASAIRFAGWNAVLSEESTDPDVLSLSKSRPISAATLYLLFRVIQLFARDRFELRVTGLEKLPRRGPFILSPNHQSFIDPFVVASVLPWPVFRELFSVGTSEIFGSGLMRRIARWLRVILVDPDANLIPAMRAGAYGLRRGRVLVLFPEGERSIDGPPKVFKKGAAILSLHLQVPIVPVAIEGFYDVWPRGKRLPQKFHTLRVSFGDPIYPPQKKEPSEADYAQLTALLRERVLEMWQRLVGKQPAKNFQVAAAN